MGGVVGPGGDDAETPGVEQFAANQAREPGLTLALAVGPAQGAKAGFGGLPRFTVPSTSLLFENLMLVVLVLWLSRYGHRLYRKLLFFSTSLKPSITRPF